MSSGLERAPVPDIGKWLSRIKWLLVGALLASLPEAVMQVMEMMNK